MRAYQADEREPFTDPTECDREPIHIPGAIQPHGILFGVSRGDYCVTAVSENAGRFFGGANLIGVQLKQLVDTTTYDQITAAQLEEGQSLRLARLRLSGRGDTIAWRGLLHAQADGSLLEAEMLPPSADKEAPNHFELFQDAIARLQTETGFEPTCRQLVAEIRRLTNYSRVMLYRFAPDWSGEVVAEDCDGRMQSYAGLHFPASDIPIQARALYARNAERQIPDVHYTPARLLQSGGTPIDLSTVGLRSVSPIHLTYLRNMGAGAAMSISLIRDGRLWGMIACHHPVAHLVASERVQSCVLLSQIAVARFTLIEEAEMARRDVAVKAVEAGLLKQAAEGEDSRGALLQADLLRHNGQALLDLLGATGLVLSAGTSLTRLGETPDGPALLRLLNWLFARTGETLAIDNLAAAYPGHADLRPAAGLLAVPLGPAPHDMIIWFRPEYARTVTWAGDPAKSLSKRPGQDRLSPRESFAAWTEQVRGRSRPWTQIDMAAANSLRDTLVEISARRAAHIERVNLHLLRSNEELESFAYVVSHDLKEPLRQIEMYGTLLQRAFDRKSDPREKIDQWFSGISVSSRRLRDLIDHLAQYSRIGSEARVFVRTDLERLVVQVLQDIAAPISAIHGRVEVGALPTVVCDAIQMRQVFQNLIGNSVKYRHPDRPLVVRMDVEERAAPAIQGEADGTIFVFRIEDNGIGFESRHCEQIFKPFERLHSAEAYDGSGLGLAICRRVIDRHGGTITAFGRPGQGSVFTFTLPQRTAFAQEKHAA